MLDASGSLDAHGLSTRTAQSSGLEIRLGGVCVESMDVRRVDKSMKSGNGHQPLRKKKKMTLAEFREREMPLLSGAVSFCSNLPMSLYADTTVVKSPEVVFRGLVLSQNHLLGEEFLLNFRRSQAEIGLLVGTNNYTVPMVVAAVAQRDLEEDDSDLISLPKYANVREPIGPLIPYARRSIRRYSGKPISLQDLSTLLFHGAGISGHSDVQISPEPLAITEDARLDFRVVASGGALYPLDLYVIATNVSQLAPGAYRYTPKHHALKPAGVGDVLADVKKMAQFHEIEIEKSSFMLCYVYNHFENARKYRRGCPGFCVYRGRSDRCSHPFDWHGARVWILRRG